MSLDLNAFKLTSSVLEYRYASNFLIWDRVGSFWSNLLTNYPAATLKTAEPNKTHVKISSDLDGVVSIDRAFVSSAGRKPNRQALIDFAEPFTRTLIANLNVTSFTRIGYRTVFSHSFSEKSAASEYFFTNCVPRQFESSYFGIEGAPTEPELGWRWEGNTLGCHVRIGARTINWDFDLPADAPLTEAPDSSRTQHSVNIDIDYYAHADTDVEQVNIKDLLESWARVTRRDIGKMFNGR